MKFFVATYIICLSFMLINSRDGHGQAFIGREVPSHKEVKILILGNSITQHNPSPAIGWNGNWGMAASEEAKDYVHLIIDSLKQTTLDANIAFANIAQSFEQRFWDYDSLKINQLSTPKPDILILRLGDNISEANLKEHFLQSDVKKLVDQVFQGNRHRVLITSAFWDKPEVNGSLQKCAQENKWDYIKVFDLSQLTENTAAGKFENAGVAKHPSDRGMKEISHRIMKSLLPMVRNAACEKQ